MRWERAGKLLCSAAALLWSSAASASNPAVLCWNATASSGGYDYTFKFSSVTPGNYNWFIFGDYGSTGPTGAQTLNSPTMLTSFPLGTFTYLTSSSGGHNGPTFLDTAFASTSGFYVPSKTQMTWTWKVHATNLVSSSNLYWSDLVSSSIVYWEPGVYDSMTGADSDADGLDDACDPDDDNDFDPDTSDCNDADSSIYTGATEICDGKDNDCDGLIDEGVGSTTFYRDSDGDGYGNASVTSTGCTAPTGYVSDKTDCDDTSSSIHPGATETCNSKDDDCDGSIDEGVTSTFYKDADGDGYGDSAKTSTGCSAPSGYVSDKTDCDDATSSIHPGATETCNSKDDDCDGSVDEGVTSTYYKDADGDGYGDSTKASSACSAPSGYVSDKTDCDDATSSIHPGATETCNSKDDDCDGSVDEGVTSTYYADADGDGYGDASSKTTGCSAPSGYVADSTDCNDMYKTVHPGASEYCNSRDDDCDGTVDENSAVDATTWYADSDGDGYGDAANPYKACSAPTGFVSNDTDCDDSDASVYPGATEVAYDGIDQDCDGADLVDADGDGYASDAFGGKDCDDDDATIHPGASETADGVDQDCDGDVDEATDWVDDDGDGFAEAGGDCDDADKAVHPDATETCDGVDEDCDGTIDEGTDCYDDDGDGLDEASGDCNDADASVYPGATEDLANGVDDDCDGVVDTGAFDDDGDGYTEDGGDCAPEDGAVSPAATEVVNGVDDDCDGEIDEGTSAYDDDGDGLSEDQGDCDDADESIAPTATEVVGNGIDDDCDGTVDEGGDGTDDDGDGWTELSGDCDDADPDVSPGATEAQNGVDDDCDGAVDEGFEDADQDGYTAEDGDCDDHDGWTGPSFDELCDGIDNNCNDQTDEGCEDTGTITTSQGKGCGCDGTGSFGEVGSLVLAGMLLVVRRRR